MRKHIDEIDPSPDVQSGQQLGQFFKSIPGLLTHLQVQGGKKGGQNPGQQYPITVLVDILVGILSNKKIGYR